MFVWFNFGIGSSDECERDKHDHPRPTDTPTRYGSVLPAFFGLSLRAFSEFPDTSGQRQAVVQDDHVLPPISFPFSHCDPASMS